MSWQPPGIPFYQRFYVGGWYAAALWTVLLAAFLAEFLWLTHQAETTMTVRAVTSDATSRTFAIGDQPSKACFMTGRLRLQRDGTAHFSGSIRVDNPEGYADRGGSWHEIVDVEALRGKPLFRFGTWASPMSRGGAPIEWSADAHFPAELFDRIDRIASHGNCFWDPLHL